jgi:hypothetical protein
VLQNQPVEGLGNAGKEYRMPKSVRAERSLPPELDPDLRIDAFKLDMGQLVVAHRVAVSLTDGSEYPVRGTLVRGEVLELPNSERPQVMVGKRPDGEPTFALSTGEYYDTDVAQQMYWNNGKFVCRIVFYPAEVLDELEQPGQAETELAETN